MRLGEYLRECRLDACLTQGQVKMETGISIPQLSRLERHSHKITFQMVMQLAKVYQISLDEIAKEVSK